MGSKLDELVNFAVESHRRDKQRVTKKLEPLLSGRIRHQTREPNGDWVDVTDNLIAEYREEIDLHDRMITAYEKMRSEGWPSSS